MEHHWMSQERMFHRLTYQPVRFSISLTHSQHGAPLEVVTRKKSSQERMFHRLTYQPVRFSISLTHSQHGAPLEVVTRKNVSQINISASPFQFPSPTLSIGCHKDVSQINISASPFLNFPHPLSAWSTTGCHKDVSQMNWWACRFPSPTLSIPFIFRWWERRRRWRMTNQKRRKAWAWTSSPCKWCWCCLHHWVSPGCFISIWLHGWEIAVILRNFRKTKLSKSKFFFLTLFQHTYNVQLDDFRFATYANIAFRHFTALPTAKPPSSFEHAWYKHGVPSA